MAHGTTAPQARPSATDRLWSKVVKTPRCWVWTASTRNGYGIIRVDGRTEYAHRLAYLANMGPIPDGLVVRHTCDNRLCVRPNHLELGTKADNSRDMVERGRSPRNPRAENTHCANGHLYDVANTYWWNGARQCRACKADHYRRKQEPSTEPAWQPSVKEEARADRAYYADAYDRADDD